MILLLLFYFIKNILLLDSSFIEELELHKITEEELRQIIKDKQNSHFIAFYEVKDLNARNIELLNSIMTVQQNYQEQISFYWYNLQIPTDIENKYYLHYYTLPKLKYFSNGKHITYRGGRSIKNVQNWVDKKFKIKNSTSIFIKDKQEFNNILKQNNKILIYIGNLQNDNFKNYLESIKILNNINKYHTNNKEVQQKFKDLNFKNGHILQVQYGLAGYFSFNRFLSKKINQKNIQKFLKESPIKDIHILDQQLFVQIGKFKENYYLYFGNKNKINFFNEFCQSFAKHSCTQITENLNHYEQLFQNYFPLNKNTIQIYYIKGQIIHQRYPIYLLENCNSVQDLIQFQNDIQNKKINEQIFSEKKPIEKNLVHYLVYKDFYQYIKNLNSDVLVLFHRNDCDKICEDYINEAEKITKIYTNKYNDKFAFKFGLFNMFKNTPPFDIQKKATFYLFPRSNPQNYIKAFVARDMSSLRNFIFKTSPVLNEIEFDEL